MLFRQFCAACVRSFSVISTRTSFSASAKVAAETSGPTAGAVPNAGGAPGGELGGGFCANTRDSAAAASMAADEVSRKSRREWDTCSPPKRALYKTREQGTGNRNESHRVIW